MSIVTHSTWEVCPECNGTGWVPDRNQYSSSVLANCTLCHGSGGVWRSEVTQAKPEELTSQAYHQGYRVAMDKCRPYLRAYAHRLWIDGQLNENREICKLLGERTAEEHETGADAP